MLPESATFRAVLLAGGQSSRMKSPKFLLSIPGEEEKPIYRLLLEQIAQVQTKPTKLHLSLRDREQAADVKIEGPDGNLTLLFDQDVTQGDIGPAAGLLAAHDSDKVAYWLVLACDYPLMTTKELEHLLAEYKEPVTCMKNAEGFAEPLVAIWSPFALNCLKENVGKGFTGPSKTIRQLDGNLIEPLEEQNLINTNTPAEWEKAMDIILSRRSNATTIDA